MYEQILTNKDGYTVKILGVLNEVIFISRENEHTGAGSFYTKAELINRGYIFPVEKWTPEMQSSYFIPNVTSRSKHNLSIWANDEMDNIHLANNLVCRTPAEAIALTNKMLGAVRV